MEVRDEDIKNFLSISTNQELAQFLGIDIKILRVHILHVYRNQYHSFEVRKKNGDPRKIIAPCDSLKTIQKKISCMMYSIHKSYFTSHGFELGKYIVTNANVHKNQKFVLNIDLKDFFPTIHFGRVRGMFKSHPFNFNNKVASSLANLCTYQGYLPQGAPSSPIISNIITKRLDRNLLDLAKKVRLKYTRYADDITFSGNANTWPKLLSTLSYEEGERKVILSNDLIKIIEDNGFFVNPKKTRLLSQDDAQVVTGLVTNRFVNVNRRYIRNIRACIKNIKNTSLELQEEKYKTNYSKSRHSDNLLAHLQGRIEFVGRVRGKDDLLYMKLVVELAEVSKDLYSQDFINLIKSKLQEPFDRIDNSLWVIESEYSWVEKEKIVHRDNSIWKKIFFWMKKEKIEVVEQEVSECTQGTAFEISGVDGLVTCRHNLFFANGDKKYVSSKVYRYSNPEEKTNVKAVIFECQHLDLATIKIPSKISNPLSVTKKLPKRSESLFFAGFPAFSRGSKPSIVNTRVTQERVVSGRQMILVDRPIVSGTSGGPILNENYEVCGVVTNGGLNSEEASTNSFNGGVWINHIF